MASSGKEELESIFVQYYEDILKYCLVRIKKDRSYAEDISNDVFVLLCKKWDSLKKDNIRAWLYRVADNLLKEFFRKQKKMQKISYIDDLDSCSDYLVYEEIFDIVSSEDIENYKNEILGNLSNEDKKLFDLHFENKKSYKEICSEFSISESALKKRIYRLKQKILDIVDKTTA